MTTEDPPTSPSGGRGIFRENVAEFRHPCLSELAFGPHGSSERTPAVLPALPDRGVSARAALEGEIAAAFGERPVFVSFSGGRDSSAVLAVAVAVARRIGVPVPTPVILRYPGDVESDETAWQERVLDHLSLDNAVVIEVTDSSTYLDAAVQRNLRRRGLLWPPALQLDDPLLAHTRGGTVLTGEGGDEVLGTRRITPLTLLRMGRRPDLGLLGWAARSLVPRRAIGPLVRRESARNPLIGWLTPAGRAALIRARVRDDRRPLHWGEETRQIAGGVAPVMLGHNFDLVAREFDVVVHHPLLAPPFLAALAVEGGRWGYAGRTHAMRELFDDLLPDDVLARTTKASFGAVRWGEPEREFARTWDGGGVPRDLVDVDALRAEWLSERPAGASALLLHAAWMHANDVPLEGVGL